MRHLAVLFLSASLSCCTLSAQYQNEPLIFEHYDTTLHFHADGTGDRILHITARLQSDGAVRQFTVISVPYDSSYGTGSIDYICVHKPDGTTIETPVADAIDMPAPVTRIAPPCTATSKKNRYPFAPSPPEMSSNINCGQPIPVQKNQASSGAQSTSSPTQASSSRKP
jgi:hypothetical protein